MSLLPSRAARACSGIDGSDKFFQGCEGVEQKVMTNRDKFNKMSNAELASVLIWTGANDRCKFCCHTKERCFGKSCFDSIKKWLNAPVEKIKELADRG